MIDIIFFGTMILLCLFLIVLTIGISYAHFYDLWYRRKYRTWLALLNDNKPRKPVAK